MNIKLTKKECRLLLACLLEIQQSPFWYNGDAYEVITKSEEGNTALYHLINKLQDQGLDLDWADPIYKKMLVKMVEEK